LSFVSGFSMFAPEKRRVLFVDEQELFCEGLLTQFKFQKDFRIVGVANDCTEAREKTEELAPDTLIVNVYIPHLCWVDMIRSIRYHFDKLVIAFLSEHAKYTEELMKAGVNAYMWRNVPEGNVVDIIASLKEDSKIIYPVDFDEHFAPLHSEIETIALTDREKEVLTLVSRGLQNKEIAHELAIKLPTVNNHLYNIFKKLNCSNRTEAVFSAMNKKIITAN
jgi:DNA-binding NarL/FixJ family response regulator